MKIAAISLLTITLIGMVPVAAGIGLPPSPALNLFGAMAMILATSRRSLGLWMGRRADEARRVIFFARQYIGGKLDEAVAAASDVRDFALCLRKDVLRTMGKEEDRCEECERCVEVRVKATVLVSMASVMVVDAVQY